MALSADVIYSSATSEVQAVPALNGDILYAGALLGVDADGYAAPWSDAAGMTLLGICMKQVTGDTSASPVPEANVSSSGMILRQISVTSAAGQTDVGALVFATDDNTFALGLTPTNVQAVGRVSRYYSGTTCDVQLFTPGEYLGLS